MLLHTLMSMEYFQIAQTESNTLPRNIATTNARTNFACTLHYMLIETLFSSFGHWAVHSRLVFWPGGRPIA